MAGQQRYYGTGKRKSAIARVWLSLGTGQITINDQSPDEYLHRERLQQLILQPLQATDTLGTLDVMAKTKGGGIAGQAAALRHGIAKALVTMDEQYRGVLGPRGLLTRDPRVKERKHSGFRRARRGKQFSKR